LAASRAQKAWFNWQIDFRDYCGVEFNDIDYVLEDGSSFLPMRSPLSNDPNRLTISSTFKYQDNCSGWNTSAKLNTKLNGFIKRIWNLEDLNLRMTELPNDRNRQGFTVFSINEGSTPVILGIANVVATVDPSKLSSYESVSGNFIVTCATVSASGDVAIYANGEKIQSGQTPLPLGGKQLRSTYKQGSRLIVYEGEMNLQGILETSRSISPIRVLKIEQSGVKIDVSPRTVEIPARGGSATVRVNAPDTTSWSGISGDPWILIDGVSSTSQSGSNILMIVVGPNNTTSSRKGSVTIADQVVEVLQPGTTVEVSAISPGLKQGESLIFGTIGSGGGILSVGVDSESTVRWSLEAQKVSDLDWVRPFPNSGIGSASVNFAVGPFDQFQSSRTAVFEIGGKSVVITQAGFKGVLNPSFENVAGNGGVYALQVKVPAGYFWEAIALSPWIKIVSRQEQDGSGVIWYQLESSTGRERFGQIIVAGELFQIFQNKDLLEPVYSIVIKKSFTNSLRIQAIGPKWKVLKLQKSHNLEAWTDVANLTAGEGFDDSIDYDIEFGSGESSWFFRCVEY
jgi:hypothetical protein